MKALLKIQLFILMLAISITNLAAQNSSTLESQIEIKQAKEQINIDSDVAVDKVDFAIKTNLLYGGITLTPNLSLEARINCHSTVELSGSYNPWNRKGKPGDNKKLVHGILQTEYRYWLEESFKKHFFGAHLIGTKFNIGNHDLPYLFGDDSKEHRHEGWGAGVGVSYGYVLPLHERFGLEFSLGLGYVYMNYDIWEYPRCGEKIENNAVKHYFGPTKASISAYYRFQL